MDVWDTYKAAKGIKALYAWQREFLEEPKLIEARQNHILWLPTGAGKTLAAEMLLLRETLVRGMNCLLILPYVAIVQEKTASLASLEEQLGVVVEEYAASKGRLPAIRRRNAKSIYVCTIEKANALVNSLLEQGRLSEIGLAIVDELHMLGESSGRGAVLEQCICKLMHYRPPGEDGNGKHIQIVGMSATLGNPKQLCKFLRAELFRTSFRPVKLVERIKVQDKLFQVDDEGNWNLEKQLPKNSAMAKRDPDGISMFLGNLIKGQVLIFCPTKQNCENLCKMLTGLCPNEFREHRVEERIALLAQLREELDGRLCPVLNAGIRHGVAYHHSGLTQDERLLVETAYKSGIISIICCTSTLAAGVNLPARRVIIRSPYVGKALLRKSQYLQMIGRAGRAGLDEKGDSITILHHGPEAMNFRKMQEGPLEPSESGLSDEQQREIFFLDLIVLKMCSSVDDLYKMLKSSLFGIQIGDEIEILNLAEKTLQSLLAKQMLIHTEDLLIATQIGSATFNANLNPQMALFIVRDLDENLGQGIVLSSHFHLLYNCVPLDVEGQDIDWNVFHNQYLALTKEERQLLHAMGFPESTIVQYILCPSGAKKSSVKAQRLYTAFMLRKIWDQVPLWEVASHFGVHRGWLQSTLQSAISHSNSIVRFAERTPNLWALRSLLPEMVKRLCECKRQELIPLLAIDCVKMGRARQLHEAGYKTVGSIARADPLKLIAALGGKLNRFQAGRIINSARTIIRDQIAEKCEELENMGAENFLIFPSLHQNPWQFGRNIRNSSPNRMEEDAPREIGSRNSGMEQEECENVNQQLALDLDNTPSSNCGLDNTPSSNCGSD